MERLKRRSRRRHRSSYDHTRHICRSILEIAETDIDESKENTQGKFLKGVKLGRSKVFIQEDTVRFGYVIYPILPFIKVESTMIMLNLHYSSLR